MDQDLESARQRLIDTALQARRGDGDRLLFSYIPGMGGLGCEDYMTRATERPSSPRSIYCDDAVINLFAFAGIAKEDWIGWCMENKGFSPTRRSATDRSSYEADRARTWQKARWRVAPGQLPLLSWKQMWTVLEEASYGGVPTFTVALKADEVRRHDFAKPMKLQPVTFGDGRETRTACGFFGLHDFVWGSGYVETVKAPVTIPAGIGNWVATEATGRGFDDIYGLVGRFYDAILIPTLPAAA